MLVTLREEHDFVPRGHDLDWWVEVDALTEHIVGRRSWWRSTDFDCNPIATQLQIIGRHSLIRCEPPPDENPCTHGPFTTVRHSSIRA